MAEARLSPHDTRRRIFETVLTYPGLSVAALGRVAGHSPSLVEYHLDAMEGLGLVKTLKDDTSRRAYPSRLAARYDDDALLMLGLMREHVPFQVLLVCLGQETAVHHGELVETIQVAKSTLTYHLDKLVARRILHRVVKGPARGYRILDRPLVHALFTDHLPVPELMDQYGSLWLDLYRKDVPPPHVKAESPR